MSYVNRLINILKEENEDENGWKLKNDEGIVDFRYKNSEFGFRETGGGQSIVQTNSKNGVSIGKDLDREQVKKFVEFLHTIDGIDKLSTIEMIALLEKSTIVKKINSVKDWTKKDETVFENKYNDLINK